MTHEVFVVLSTLLLVIAMVAVGIACIRRGRRGLGVASTLAAVATVVTFAATPESSPGTMQRVWALVMCSWIVGAAIVALWRPVTRE
jgi:hypothetical membrane protein